MLPAGPFGVLVEFGSLDEVQRCFAWVERWRASRPGVLVDVVPAERTLMAIATFDDAGQRGLREFVAALGHMEWAAEGSHGAETLAADAEIVELPVTYGGPDLEEVARLAGLTAHEIVSLHTRTEFTVAFTGFAPGFAYLTGLPDALRVPRRAAPRTRVPAGAVALGGPYSGVYPRESPGGWQLIGRLAAWAPALWDEARSAPALLRPGMRVRFRDAAGHDGPDGPAARHGVPAGTDRAEADEPGLRVVRAGLLATVQDLGRPGFAHLGVPRSGAVDRASLKLANRLVGNDEGAAALELTFGGGAFQVEMGRWVAVAGARCAVRVFAPGAGGAAADDSGHGVDRAAAGEAGRVAGRAVGEPRGAESGAVGGGGAGSEAGGGAGSAACPAGGSAAGVARGPESSTTGAASAAEGSGVGAACEAECSGVSAARATERRVTGAVGEAEDGAAGTFRAVQGGGGGGGRGAFAGAVAAGGGAEGGSLLSPAPSHQQMILRTVPGTAFYAPEGAVVDMGPAEVGVRAYLAVAGGVGGAAVLGSRAADLLAGVGGRVLGVGDRVGVGSPVRLPPDIPGLGMAPVREPVDPVVVRLVLGPRSEWFTAEAVRVLATARWVVGAESNRTAVRLEGPALQRARDGEPASEPMIVGAVQVPRDGRPVLFLADHPVTGGYPVIACAYPADLDAVGQARPGTGIRFRMVGGSGW